MRLRQWTSFAIVLFVSAAFATDSGAANPATPKPRPTPAQAAAALTAATCENVVAIVNEFASDCVYDAAKSQACRDAAGAVAAKFFECNAANAFFESSHHFIDKGDRTDSWWGEAAFDALEAKGKQPFAKLLAYLDGGSDRFARFVKKRPNEFSETEKTPWSGVLTFRWLRKHHRDPASCAEVEKRTTKLDGFAQYLVIRYLSEVGCNESAEKSAFLWLVAGSPTARIEGCRALGLVGKSKDVLERLDRVAQTDPHNEVDENEGIATRVYPVREACALAANKVRQRL